MNDPVLDLFKTQLDQELEHLAQTRRYLNAVSGDPDSGVAFPHWYFERVEQMEESEANEIITEGLGDEKIDAIHISEDGTTVRFFQFKICKNKQKGIDDGAIDGIINSLNTYLLGNKKSKELSDQFKRIKSTIRTSYKIVLITSGAGLASRQRQLIQNSIDQWNTSRNAFSYEEINLSSLSNLIYTKNLPTINSKIKLRLDTPPYQTQIGTHKSLVCDITATAISDEYGRFGEKLLQQNIRNAEKDSLANQAIYRTAITPRESQDFYFYNNGITIICDRWDYDQPSWFLEIDRPQVVNGGQTLRQLSKANSEGRLRSDVKVLLRVISIGSDREFAGNVAINLNNQTLVKSSFLKSNHPFFIQMQQSLLQKGWYFERKRGDWDNLTEIERNDLISKIGDETKIIQIQTGCQAYCAAFLQDIDLAKKNPKNMFLSKAYGGKFEDIASNDFTANKLIQSYSLLLSIQSFFNDIKNIQKNTKTKPIELSKLLKLRRQTLDYANFRKMLSNANFFICGLVSYQLKFNLTNASNKQLIQPYIAKALSASFYEGSGSNAAWGTLLRSQQFFESVKKKLKT